MATTTRTPFEDSTKGGYALGLEIFGAVIMMTLGTFQAFEGLSAILKDNVYVAGIDYVWEFDLTTWGWIHLTVGVVAVITGLGLLFGGQTWARIFGIVIAVVAALLNFMFIPYYPIWSLVVIAFCVAVVWALSTTLRHD
jgi:hypothetical protein